MIRLSISLLYPWLDEYQVLSPSSLYIQYALVWCIMPVRCVMLEFTAVFLSLFHCLLNIKKSINTWIKSQNSTGIQHIQNLHISEIEMLISTIWYLHIIHMYQIMTVSLKCLAIVFLLKLNNYQWKESISKWITFMKYKA